MNKQPSITAEGRKDLEQELAGLIAQRPAIAERIATARAFGDLSENEDYSAARGEQKVVEGRILEIQGILKNAKIIKAGKKSQIALGANITLEGAGKTMNYTLVGAIEANPLSGKISDESPVGKALLGRKLGDEVSFPNGKVYKITDIA